MAVFIGGISAVLVVMGPEQTRPPRYLCRVCLWLYGVGSVARLWSLAAFSLSVLAIVRFGKKTLSLLCAAVIITTLWIASIPISLYIVLPYVYEVQFVHGVACFPDNSNVIIIPARGALFTIWVTVGSLVQMTVSIVVPIICLCYIKKNTVTEDTQYRKAMAKFSLFLVLGGAINIVGQILPAVVANYTEAPGVYLSYGIVSVSLIPTPIIIIAYFKPVQEQLKKIVTCGKLAKQAKDSEWTTSTPSIKGTEKV